MGVQDSLGNLEWRCRIPKGIWMIHRDAVFPKGMPNFLENFYLSGMPNSQGGQIPCDTVSLYQHLPYFQPRPVSSEIPIPGAYFHVEISILVLIFRVPKFFTPGNLTSSQFISRKLAPPSSTMMLNGLL